MDSKIFQKLCDEAKRDPKFFHGLVFDTEKMLVKATYLDRMSKGALLLRSPEEVMAYLVGETRNQQMKIFDCVDSCEASRS